MGREIKFRAWDGDMVYFNFDDLYYNTICINHGVYDVPVMQYTGLKDKNGKEIYEGDIVKGKDSDDQRIIGNVQYRMTSFKVNGIGKYTFIQCSLNREFKVIGNIYENADLL